MDPIANVSVFPNANVYFDGKCISHTIETADGTRKSVGVILPSTLNFSTAAPEIMQIAAGKCRVKIAGENGWHDYADGTTIRGTGRQQFRYRGNRNPALRLPFRLIPGRHRTAARPTAHGCPTLRRQGPIRSMTRCVGLGRPIARSAIYLNFILDTRDNLLNINNFKMSEFGGDIARAYRKAHIAGPAPGRTALRIAPRSPPGPDNPLRPAWPGGGTGAMAPG